MRYTSNEITISSYKQQLNGMVKMCNKNSGLVNESYSYGLKRVINHKVTKFNKILETNDVVDRLYKTYDNIDGDSSNIKAYASLLYVFNNKPLSVMESLNLAKSFDNAVSLSLKDDSHNALHNMSDIIEYIEASKIYINFLESEINYINNVLTGEALDILSENFFRNGEYAILTEALNISNTMTSFRKVLDGIFNMIKNTGISYKVKSMNVNKWKTKYTNRMEDKVDFSTEKDVKKDDKETNVSKLSLTYYDKNANVCKIILKNIDKFYTTTPAFDTVRYGRY